MPVTLRGSRVNPITPRSDRHAHCDSNLLKLWYTSCSLDLTPNLCNLYGNMQQLEERINSQILECMLAAIILKVPLFIMLLFSI